MNYLWRRVQELVYPGRTPSNHPPFPAEFASPTKKRASWLYHLLRGDSELLAKFFPPPPRCVECGALDVLEVPGFICGRCYYGVPVEPGRVFTMNVPELPTSARWDIPSLRESPTVAVFDSPPCDGFTRPMDGAKPMSKDQLRFRLLQAKRLHDEALATPPDARILPETFLRAWETMAVFGE